MSFLVSLRIRINHIRARLARLIVVLLVLALVGSGMVVVFRRSTTIPGNQAMNSTNTARVPQVASKAALGVSRRAVTNDSAASKMIVRSAAPKPAAPKTRTHLARPIWGEGGPRFRVRSSGLEQLEMREMLTNWYVAPDGSPTNNGTINSPWDIASALDNTTQVKPGDSLLLRGGTYYSPDRTPGAHGFGINLQGSADASIIIKPYGSEHAVIDGGLFSGQQYVPSNIVIEGLEILVSENLTQTRTSAYTGSEPPPDLVRPWGGIDLVKGTNISIINNYIHDNMQGIGLWSGVTGGLIYGNVIDDNGWTGPDRGHGHGIYTQNNGPVTDTIADNVVFGNYGLPLHAYGSSLAQVNDYDIEGNLFAGNEMALIGSQATLGFNHIILNNNVVYGVNLKLGYSSPGNDAVVEGNTIVSGELQLMDGSTNVTAQNNFWWTGGQHAPDNNTAPVPTAPFVFLEPNQYDRNRANVAVIDFQPDTQMQVSVGDFLHAGDTYEVMDPSNLFGAPVASGTYDGSGTISVPLSGNMSTIYQQYAAQYQAYVILRQPSPVASDSKSATHIHNQVTIDVLANVSDPGGQVNPATVQIETDPTDGSVSVDPTTGQVTYTPNVGVAGDDSFSFKVQDVDGLWSNMATVAVEIAHESPNAGNKNASTGLQAPVTINVLANDTVTDAPLDPTSVQVVSGPANGTVSINSTDGSITYTPASNEYGQDQFTYRVADIYGLWSNTATVSVNVAPQDTTALVRSIRWLYFDVLGRQPSAAELQSWENFVQHGGFFQQLAQAVVQSAEYRTRVINGIYEEYLGRTADAGGLNYWLGIWAATGGPGQVEDSVLASPEYYSHAGASDAKWVQALYENVLGRAPGQSELDYWTEQLQHSSKEAVANGFVGSLEYRLDQVKGWYGEYLRRSIDPQGALYFANRLAAGLTNDAAQEALLGSSEYEQGSWAS